MGRHRPVVVNLNVQGFGQSESETLEVDRDEWDALTPAERLVLVDSAAADFAANYVGWGWYIADPGDMNAVGT